MKILTFLSIAQNTDPNNRTTTHGEERILQYLDGLDKFFQYSKVSDFDVVIVDNTITKDSPLDIRIANIAHKNNAHVISCDKNEYGCRNKGAGIIEQWRYCKGYMLKYDWIIHFEPRQLLRHFDFLDSFFLNPRNLFNRIFNFFHTGLFAVERKTLINFINVVSLDWMVNSSTSIEYLIHDYFIDNNYKFHTIQDSGILWHDVCKNRWETW